MHKNLLRRQKILYEYNNINIHHGCCCILFSWFLHWNVILSILADWPPRIWAQPRTFVVKVIFLTVVHLQEVHSMDTTSLSRSKSTRWIWYPPTSSQWPHAALHRDFWKRLVIFILHLEGFFFRNKNLVISSIFCSSLESSSSSGT